VRATSHNQVKVNPSYQNYLALCPNHAAMFKHANASKDELKFSFLLMEDRKSVQVELAGKLEMITFSSRHQLDLSAVIKSDNIAKKNQL
jgi:hypothetical protein